MNTLRSQMSASLKTLVALLVFLMSASDRSFSAEKDLDVTITSKDDCYNIINYTSSADLYSKMYDLEGKIIKIYFPDDNPKQISKEYFSLNGGSYEHGYLVYIPSPIGQKYFGNTSKRVPNALYAKVTITTLVNAFGNESKGVLLYGLGTKYKTKIKNEIEISW